MQAMCRHEDTKKLWRLSVSGQLILKDAGVLAKQTWAYRQRRMASARQRVGFDKGGQTCWLDKARL